MGDKPVMVSIIMLAYNHEKYIEDAIESVIEQETSFPIEILIGDDASSDSTATIIEKFAQKYPAIIPVIREENMGATRNLYDLQMRAGGKYIAYLECDDYWCDKTKLQQQVDFLEKNNDFIACTHRCRLVNNKGESLKHQHLEWISNKEIYTVDDFKGVVLAGHNNTMVHRNIFKDSNDIYEDIIKLHPVIGDRSICLLLASKGKIYQIKNVMSCYRKPEADTLNSATAQIYINNSKRVLDDYLLTKKLEQYTVEKLRVDGKFNVHKRDLFISAVWGFVRKPCWKNVEIVWTILRRENAAEYLLYLPVGVVKKMIGKLR